MTWIRFVDEDPNDVDAGWRYHEDGRIILEGGLAFVGELKRYVELDDVGAIRTKGKPKTARTLRAEYGKHIAAAGAAFGIPEHVIAGMIAIEAKKLRGTSSYDPFSRRDEDGLDFRDMADRKRRVSFGLGQHLWTTAIATLERNRDRFPTEIASIDELHAGHLCVPEISIWLIASYIADELGELDRSRLTGPFDPGWIPIVGAYNAGRLALTDSNPWNIRTFGRDRVAKFAAYANDYLAAS